jgi:hypothetical protein
MIPNPLSTKSPVTYIKHHPSLLPQIRLHIFQMGDSDLSFGDEKKKAFKASLILLKIQSPVNTGLTCRYLSSGLPKARKCEIWQLPDSQDFRWLQIEQWV